MRVRLGTPKWKLQIPNSKLQGNSKLQIPNLSAAQLPLYIPRLPLIEAWNLVHLWSLVFGAWSFPRLPLLQEITGAKPVRDIPNAECTMQSAECCLFFILHSEFYTLHSTGGSSFLGEWLSGNSRPHRSRICEPWRCKSSLAHQFHGVEATADRHRTFNPVW